MMRFATAFGALFWIAAPAAAQIVSAPSGPGGSSTITANSTATSGFAANNLIYSDGSKVQSLATANSGVLVTSAGGVPSISSTLPAGLTIPGFAPLASPTFTGTVTMPDSGTWTSTAVSMVGNTITVSSGNANPVMNWSNATGGPVFQLGGVPYFKLNGATSGVTGTGVVEIDAAGGVRIAGTGSAFLSGTANGILNIANGSQLLGAMQFQSGYSVAGTPLPTCNAGAKGTFAFVTDATAPTYLANYAGSGAVNAPVFCDGTNWKTY